MDIFINKIHYPVKCLGPGVRLGIWFQGCTIHCAGCINPDTWEFLPERRIDSSDFLGFLDKYRGRQVDGVTITGGEPFDQATALLEILKYLPRVTQGDVLVYSGYRYSHLKKRFQDVLKHIDVLISEPYVESEGDELIWRGSDNQKIHLLSEKAKKIYPATVNKMKFEGRRMQFSVVGDDVYMIGIPARSDLDRLYDNMRKRGIARSGEKQDDCS